MTVLDPDLVIQTLQLVGSGLLSKRTALEQLGLVQDVDEELRRIKEEK